MAKAEADTSVDVIVAGAGPAGLTAAAALAAVGFTVAAIDPKLGARQTPDAPLSDTRTTALFDGSLNILRNLGLWSGMAAHAAPLKTLAMVDATGRLVAAPDVRFSAREVGHDAFGWNIANRDLVRALEGHIAGLDTVRMVRAASARIQPNDDNVTVILEDGATIRASALVGADGRQSRARKAAGIPARTWRYPQVAMTTWFHHTQPHHDTSTEFHRAPGPLTTVPLPGHRSSLVWVEHPERAEMLLTGGEALFKRELERHLTGLLGAVSDLAPRSAFPLSSLVVDRFAADRIFLVGEAAHAFPPIGAQGLNLGFRDVAVLIDVLTEGAGAGAGDPGAPHRIAAYDRRRRFDVASRTTAVDLLNRSLVSDILPLSIGRSLGLQAMARLGPLRRRLMKEGMQPSGPTPRLMQPDRPIGGTPAPSTEPQSTATPIPA